LFIIAGAFCVFTARLHALYDPSEMPVFSVPVSARSSALGNSVYCDESEAIRYNPAWLGNSAGSSLLATYGAFMRDTSFSSIIVNVEADASAWSLGVTDIRSAFENYAGPDSGSSGKIIASQSLVSAGYGVSGADLRFLTGFALKMTLDKAGEAASHGYSADIGAGYRCGERCRIGLVIKNAMAMSAAEEDRPSPDIIISGAFMPAFAMPLQPDDKGNTLYVAAGRRMFAGYSFHAGWESMIGGFMSVRIGFDRTYPCGGIGFIAGGAGIDIAGIYKETGLQYLMTLTWKFSGAGAPTAVKAVAAAKKEIKNEPEKPKVADKTAEWIDNGYKFLQAGNYVKAESWFRKVLRKNYYDVAARDGIRAVVEAVVFELKHVLESVGAGSVEFEPVTVGEALEISSSGGCGGLLAVIRHCTKKTMRQAADEWKKMPRCEAGFMAPCGEALELLRRKEVEASIARADKLVKNNEYRKAIVELEANYVFASVTEAELQLMKGLSATYDYLGRTCAKNYLAEAQRLIDEGETTLAEIYLRRVISTGYDTEKAQQLLGLINNRK